ncbi:hypothetical protein [Rhodanobacter sp. MP7CTX1]|uniref:hypothetical protein n=1 Tax=Rhodanobacter sp. MP7CTX1 TaxID=2723084 RepID=UPI0016213C20|nr:hypothetical protein [Rhodanobacter sp. MP7CTX1]MBB6187564.1 hypothetical protein [Rhodanobacter sp. MP7CTX1]
MKMTFKKLEEMILEGRGLGVGDKYQPWEQITRRRSSPRSNLNLIPVPHLIRLTHFLSRGEREFGLLLWWIGAEDVREQYPLWPWAHRQPLDQISGVEPKMAKHPGMAWVAKEAGIKLNNYLGLRVPVVLSIDLIATVPPALGPSRLVGFSCKPLDLFRSAGPRDWLRERLELDRRYCIAAHMRHHLIHPEQISKTLVVQLHWLAPIEPWPQLKQFIGSESYQIYLEMMGATAYAMPACAASRSAGMAAGWSEGEDRRALEIAIWYQHLDVDLLQPVHTTRPLRPGGIALREQLQRKWLGEHS